MVRKDTHLLKPGVVNDVRGVVVPVEVLKKLDVGMVRKDTHLLKPGVVNDVRGVVVPVDTIPGSMYVKQKHLK